MTALALDICGWFAADEPPQPQQPVQENDIETVVVDVVLVRLTAPPLAHQSSGGGRHALCAATALLPLTVAS